MKHLHNRPLSSLMLKGQPFWATTSWSAALALGEQIRDRIPTVGWYEAWITTAEIKTMGGFHCVDGPYLLSFHVAGHTVTGIVCIFVPLLPIQAEVPASKFVEGHANSWDYEKIPMSKRAGDDYLDGRNENDVGLLDSDKQFVSSPSRPVRRGNQGRSPPTHDGSLRVASERVNTAWKSHDALAPLVPSFYDRPAE